jgi:bacteriocin biosynthesis cyclodehydratase domain-containing protein
LETFQASEARWMVPVDDGVLIGRRATVLQRVRGKQPFPELAATIAATVRDSPRSIQELTEQLPEYPPALVADVSRKLAALGVLDLVDAGAQAAGSKAPGLPDRDEEGALTRYLQEHAADAAQSLERLSTSNVVVWGAGDVARRLRRELAAWHVDRITAVEAPLADDGRLTPGQGATSDGASGADAQRRAVEAADLVVGCADEPVERLRVFPRVDDLSLEFDTPWLAGHLDGHELLLGPLFVPGETGCYRCLEAREESHMPNPNEFHAFKDYVRRVGVSCWAETPLVGPSMLAGAMALEAVRILGKVTFPATYQTLITLNLLTFESRQHILLKVPFCDFCGPQTTRPFRRIWDL